MGWKIPCTTFVENIGLDIDDVPSTCFVVVAAAAASCIVVASFGIVVVAAPSFVRLLEGLCGLTLQKGHCD